MQQPANSTLPLDVKPTTMESNRLRSNVLEKKQKDEVIPFSNYIKTEQHIGEHHSYKIDQSEETYENIPSCDDCGVMFDSMHNLQRHIKTWCPENESLKRKREDADTTEDSPSKKPSPDWIEYDSNSNNGSEDEDADNIDENEAVDTVETIWDNKYEKYIEKGIDEKDTVQESNNKITPLVQRQFFKRYGEALKQIVPLERSNTHTDIVRQIEDFLDDDTYEETAIQRILKRNRHKFNDLFDDDYFEKNNEESENDEDDNEDDYEED